MSAVPPVTTDRSYRADIDGIRAIAILSVVLYHAELPFMSGGFSGVDIFFVISGYLIGGHIFSELRSGSFSFLRFYQRRAKRILPAFYFVLAATFLAAMFLLSPYEADKFSRAAVTATLSVSNIYFWHGANYFETASTLQPLLMTWSLGVEEQFYFIIPLLMVLLARIRRDWIMPAILIVCALSLALASYEVFKHPQFVFFLLPARIWELGAGVALAVAESSRGRKVVPERFANLAALLGLAGMIVPAFLLKASTPFPGLAAVPSVLGTVLIIATPSSWINRRLLSLSPLVFVGRISYSWYLWHWPMLSFLRIVCIGTLTPAGVALAVAGSFAAAVFSYNFIEQPFRKSTRPPVPLLIRYAALSAAIVIIFAGVWVTHGVPKRFPIVAQIDSESSELLSDQCLVRFGAGKPNLSHHCYDPSDGRPAVALWGDSHSSALVPALRPASNSLGYNFIQIGKASCMPLSGVARSWPLHPALVQECFQFNKQALKLLETDSHIKIVVIAGKWNDAFPEGTGNGRMVEQGSQAPGSASDEANREIFKQSLRASIQSLQAAGKHVIVFDDVPEFSFDPLYRFRTVHIPMRNAIATWLGADTSIASSASPVGLSVASTESALLKQVDASVTGIDLVDPKTILCSSPTLCSYEAGKQVLYLDKHHLSPEGARYALRDFRLPAPATLLAYSPIAAKSDGAKSGSK